ncbi:hypothetical protein [Chitinophaga polysaccharea]|nr:hypothetical protein [Chitinophaga polysaccharea]
MKKVWLKITIFGHKYQSHSMPVTRRYSTGQPDARLTGTGTYCIN